MGYKAAMDVTLGTKHFSEKVFMCAGESVYVRLHALNY